MITILIPNMRPVIPAKAGIHNLLETPLMDSRFRGNDNS
jgi:hypothetical protein